MSVKMKVHPKVPGRQMLDPPKRWPTFYYDEWEDGSIVKWFLTELSYDKKEDEVEEQWGWRYVSGKELLELQKQKILQVVCKATQKTEQAKKAVKAKPTKADKAVKAKPKKAITKIMKAKPKKAIKKKRK